MTSRLGTDAAELRTALAGVGARLRAAPRYQRDVERLRRYSARVQDHLTQYEETKVGDVTIKIDRDSTRAAVDAAKTDSLVLVGEPGAGKSAVVSAAAEQLRTDGHEVIELAVDRLLVGSLDGLKDVLGLDNSLRQVLENWPGSEPAFLFIDALDATRGGLSEAVLRGLIAEILEMPDNRWRVVASIRSFDLRLGEQFKNLFAGTPPSAQYFDPAFSNVRHVHVPRWSDAELAQVLATAPAIATAIVRAGDKLRDLARVPFNTRLLADLITGGLPAEAFGQVSHQVQLLKLYWQYRVEQHGIGAELCLKKAVEQMVAARGLQANRLEVAREDPTAYDNLRRSNVLITVSNDRYVSFRHHILFDYAASRVFINPADVTATADLLRRDRGLGLMLAPALGYALQDLWVDGQNGRSHFWQAVIQFAGDVGSDPIARSVAARSACELPQTAADILAFDSDEVIARSDEVFSLLARQSLIADPPSPVAPTQISAYADRASVARVYHALWIARRKDGAHFDAFPQINVYPSIVVERHDGQMIYIVDQLRGRLTVPHNYDGLASHIDEVGQRATELLQVVNDELSAALQPSPITAFTGFQIPNTLAATLNLDLNGKFLKSWPSPNEFLLITGVEKHFLLPYPSVDPCAGHAWGECHALHVNQRSAPIVNRSFEPASFFTTIEPHHCAHRTVHDRRAARCHISPFEEFLCCRACVFQKVCWAPEELGRLPCGLVATPLQPQNAAA